MSELTKEGIDPTEAIFERELDVRYTGQGYELRVSLDGLGNGGLKADDMQVARSRFDDRHAQIHGHAAKDRSVEIVSYRIRLRVAVPKYEPVTADVLKDGASPENAIKGTRDVYFSSGQGIKTTLFERDRLQLGEKILGPAIIEQFDATTVVPEGWVASVDAYKNLILYRKLK